MAKYIVIAPFTAEMPFVGGVYNPNRPKKNFILGEEIEASEKSITDTSLHTSTMLISSDGYVIPNDKIKPMDKKFTDGTQNGMNAAALKTSTSKPSIFIPTNILLGAAGILVVFGILKWQKVI